MKRFESERECHPRTVKHFSIDLWGTINTYLNSQAKKLDVLVRHVFRLDYCSFSPC